MRKSSDWNSSPTLTVWYEIVLNSTMVQRSLCVHPRFHGFGANGDEFHEIVADVARLIQAADRRNHRLALTCRQSCRGHVAKFPLDVRFAHGAFCVASRIADFTHMCFA